MQQQTISLTEVLKLLGWSRNRFHKRKRKGTLPFKPLPRLRGQGYEFSKTEVEAYLRQPIDMDTLVALKKGPIIPVEAEQLPDDIFSELPANDPPKEYIGIRTAK